MLEKFVKVSNSCFWCIVLLILPTMFSSVLPQCCPVVVESETAFVLLESAYDRSSWCPDVLVSALFAVSLVDKVTGGAVDSRVAEFTLTGLYFLVIDKVFDWSACLSHDPGVNPRFLDSGANFSCEPFIDIWKLEYEVKGGFGMICAFINEGMIIVDKKPKLNNMLKNGFTEWLVL